MDRGAAQSEAPDDGVTDENRSFSPRRREFQASAGPLLALILDQPRPSKAAKDRDPHERSAVP